ncbi:Threonine dehydrogenase [Nakamurella panacisegetis]|uniref:Threonine dehydrogenase n=1 Tax=Nakamurella panacisegetis TaxID=1090615 RepID=A0A1H0KHX0_9ACTN|nr:alcohol dehydrogenase catalytic domain-containing protein [Nakamurella panacisegetis]SDO55539.1 Threonine dehydrogenase [Nakamurella panacisegetis]
MATIRALVLDGPRLASVQDVPAPVARPGQAVVDVHRVGVCGTDSAFYSGEMAYLATGQARYPLRPGHEWCGVVASVGSDDDAPWIGRRVTGDTMLGCRQCERCRAGRSHLCENRYEIGVLGGWNGAVAEQVLVPVSALHILPDSVDDTAGAMVEPGANSRRAADAAVTPGVDRVAVFGPGTIGLLAAAFAAGAGAEVHVIGRSSAGLDLARTLGLTAWSIQNVPTLRFDAVIDGTDGAEIPSAAIDLVEPGGRIICVGIAGRPSLVDTRRLVVKDLTLTGQLSGSPAMAATIGSYADGSIDPAPLVAATVGLDRAPDVIAGWRPDDAGPGPKIHIDPRI